MSERGSQRTVLSFVFSALYLLSMLVTARHAFQPQRVYQSSPPYHHLRHRFQQTIVDAMQHFTEQEENFPQQIENYNKDRRIQGNNVLLAKMVPLTALEQCGERLRQGNLVAFPTETVYGLGCDAMNPAAIIKVFEAKERPLTDPLICHVTDPQMAYSLWEVGTANSTASMSLQSRALQALCQKFWPGPFTLVAKAALHVPPLLMANTGFVACRSPQHPIAAALINAARVPIAAPSANKFGHVSPTRSQHVWDDLKYEDVWIVEEHENHHGMDGQRERNQHDCCDIGVESSVAKIEMLGLSSARDEGTTLVKGRITLLRQGAISVCDIQDCIEEAGLAGSFEVLERTKKATDESVSHVAPGQTIRHYSPNIQSFVLSHSLIQQSSSIDIDSGDKALLTKSVLIDFGAKLKAWELHSLAYRDLSAAGDSAEATRKVFDTLRWAEKVEGADRILFPEIVGSTNNGSRPDALTLALKDKLTRAASGVIIDSLENR
jgi:L-threonylcarbamoyladenylate synthase